VEAKHCAVFVCGGRVTGRVSEADLLPMEEFRVSDPDRYTQLRRLAHLAKAGPITAGELMTSPALSTRADATPSAPLDVPDRPSDVCEPVVAGRSPTLGFSPTLGCARAGGPP
jgi:hypothetical protein